MKFPKEAPVLEQMGHFTPILHQLAACSIFVVVVVVEILHVGYIYSKYKNEMQNMEFSSLF